LDGFCTLVVLDVGCGDKKRGDIGVDVRRLPGVDVVCDVHSLPFADESFDEVCSSLVIEHTLNPFQFIQEQIRVLKKYGILRCEADNACYWRFNISFSPFEEDFVTHFRSADYSASEEHNMIFYPESIARLFKKSGLKKIRVHPKASVRKLDRLINLMFPKLRKNLYRNFVVTAEKD
jgi:SAM-dependent methyltransferase